jgi:perosamine synthetase
VRSPSPNGDGAIETLEHAFSSMLGISGHVVALNSGTAALHCALAALEVPHGSGVLVPDWSVPMCLAAIHSAGLVAVPFDLPESGWAVNWSDLESRWTPDCRVMLAVHMWGIPLEMQKLSAWARERGMWVIEDACQAFGSEVDGLPVGTVGDAGVFSLKDGKIVSAGEGGILVTQSSRIGDYARQMRSHWFGGDSWPIGIGSFNYRMADTVARLATQEVRAASGLLKGRRQQTARFYERIGRVVDLSSERLPNTTWNHFSPIFEVAGLKDLPHLATKAGVTNSVGTFGLGGLHRLWPISEREHSFPNVERRLSGLVAPVIHRGMPDSLLAAWARNLGELLCKDGATRIVGVDSDVVP